MNRRINSRRKGARGELEFIQQHLQPYWPTACRNLDQFKEDKRDCLNVAGCHFQIKRTERLDLWGALGQAEGEAAATDLPVVAFRRSRSKWYCVVEASELVALLRLREAS
jgi:hypothetical protein